MTQKHWGRKLPSLPIFALLHTFVHVPYAQWVNGQRAKVKYQNYHRCSPRKKIASKISRILKVSCVFKILTEIDDFSTFQKFRTWRDCFFADTDPQLTKINNWETLIWFSVRTAMQCKMVRIVSKLSCLSISTSKNLVNNFPDF